jgi:hypothetical protein
MLCVESKQDVGNSGYVVNGIVENILGYREILERQSKSSGVGYIFSSYLCVVCRVCDVGVE